MESEKNTTTKVVGVPEMSALSISRGRGWSNLAEEIEVAECIFCLRAVGRIKC